MELIYKDALLKELGITNEECEKCAWGDGYGYCTRGGDFTDACDAICTAPVIEERNGKWIKDSLCTVNGETYAVRRCSQCKSYFHDVVFTWNYCPNCGAKMEGEQP